MKFKGGVLLIVYLGSLVILVLMVIFHLFTFQRKVDQSFANIDNNHEIFRRRIKNMENQIKYIESLVKRNISNFKTPFTDEITTPSIQKWELISPFQAEITQLEKLSEEISTLKESIENKVSR